MSDNVHNSENTASLAINKEPQQVVLTPLSKSEQYVAIENDSEREVMPQEKKEKSLSLAGAGAVMVAVVAFGVSGWFHDQPTQAIVATLPVVEVRQKPNTENPYANVTIEGKAAIVFDVHEKKVLYAINEKEPLPLASITKLMTSLLAVESLQTDTHIAVSPHAIETEGDSGLFANESWKLGDLLSFTMLTSSNDGADAIATAVGALQVETPADLPDYKLIDTFVKRMNTRAKELNLTSTKFNNATGLDEPGGREGGMGSAEDVAKLLTYIWENEPEAIVDTDQYHEDYTSLDGFIHPAENTNDYVHTTPGLMGSKTGYTERAGGNLSIIYNAGLNHPIALVVLGSSLDGRFSDVHTLVEATYDYVESGWYEYETAGSSLKY